MGQYIHVFTAHNNRPPKIYSENTPLIYFNIDLVQKRKITNTRLTGGLAFKVQARPLKSSKRF